MIGGLLVMGGLGALLGLGLAVASKVFYVYVDPKIEAVEELLPGANCGGCGYPGCSANAEAIVMGKSSPASCVAASPEVIQQIAEVVGAKLELKEPEVAKPNCRYGVLEAERKYIYDGIRDCRAAIIIDGGEKECPIGCLGLGTCVKACPFGALSIGPDRLPVVNRDLCTGCGTCERVCPKQIIKLSSNSLSIVHEYTTDECTAPCQRACPAGIDIPAYIKAIREGNYEEALIVIKRSNPFPAVCGRICVHPCEYECRRNLIDEPVAINPLKRFVSDWEREKGIHVQVPRAPEREERIAIAGGGVEGLTSAYLLNRLGYSTKVYEATSRLGGILWLGLPENRLPREVIEWDIKGILDAGVEVETDKMLGKDITIGSILKDGYSAVLIAIGGWDMKMYLSDITSAPFTPLPGVQLLLDFMLRHKEGKEIKIGSSVVIIGGGAASLEAARICKENGAEKVYILVRSSKEQALFKEQDIADLEDGVEILFQTALTKMMGRDNALEEVEVCEITPEGREGEDRRLIKADTILVGAGRFPELMYVRREEEDEAKNNMLWETISPYAGPGAEQEIGIFRPGEVLSDYKAAVEAIGAGRRMAASVHNHFRGLPVEAPRDMIRKDTHVLTVHEIYDVKPSPRQKMLQRSMDTLIQDPSAEITLGYTEFQAREEAKRCLQCGLICYSKEKLN